MAKRYFVPCLCLAGEAMVTRDEWVAMWRRLEARPDVVAAPPRTPAGRIPNRRGEYPFRFADGEVRTLEIR